MKIVVTSAGENKESIMDPRFGRAAFFAVYDSEEGTYEMIDNSANLVAGGAGIRAGQTMDDNNVDAVITGNVGPNAMNVLKVSGIKIYRGENISVEENIDKFNKGELKEITETVPEHFGMGQRGV